MSIVLFYLDRDGYAVAERFHSAALIQVLETANARRKEGYTHVSISSEHDEEVGQRGVDAVVAGKLPSGEKYGWRKRRP